MDWFTTKKAIKSNIKVGTDFKHGKFDLSKSFGGG